MAQKPKSSRPDNLRNAIDRGLAYPLNLLRHQYMWIVIGSAVAACVLAKEGIKMFHRLAEQGLFYLHIDAIMDDWIIDLDSYVFVTILAVAFFGCTCFGIIGNVVVLRKPQAKVLLEGNPYLRPGCVGGIIALLLGMVVVASFFGNPFTNYAILRKAPWLALLTGCLGGGAGYVYTYCRRRTFRVVVLFSVEAHENDHPPKATTVIDYTGPESLSLGTLEDADRALHQSIHIVVVEEGVDVQSIATAILQFKRRKPFSVTLITIVVHTQETAAKLRHALGVP